MPSPEKPPGPSPRGQASADRVDGSENPAGHLVTARDALAPNQQHPPRQPQAPGPRLLCQGGWPSSLRGVPGASPTHGPSTRRGVCVLRAMGTRRPQSRTVSLSCQSPSPQAVHRAVPWGWDRAPSRGHQLHRYGHPGWPEGWHVGPQSPATPGVPLGSLWGPFGGPSACPSGVPLGVPLGSLWGPSGVPGCPPGDALHVPLVSL